MAHDPYGQYGGERPCAPLARAPWQAGGFGWERGYAPPQPPPPSSFQDTYPRAPGQYPFFPDPYGQYGGFDPFARMAHDQGFLLQLGVDLSLHEDVDAFFTDPPGRSGQQLNPHPSRFFLGRSLAGPQ